MLEEIIIPSDDKPATFEDSPVQSNNITATPGDIPTSSSDIHAILATPRRI